MGTPHFAIPSLQALAESSHQGAAVVTNPDRPKGRGRQLTPPPVKESARALGIDVLQPDSTRDLYLAEALATLLDAPDRLSESRAAVPEYVARFGWEPIAQEYATLYDEVARAA